MIPWMKEQITEALNSRRSSRSARRASLNGPSEESGGMQTSSKEEDSFFINIMSVEGKNMSIAVMSEFTFEKVKYIAVESFYGQDKSKTATQFRLVHATELKAFEDNQKLQDEEISESDQLLLVEVRPYVETDILTDEILRGPTIDEIMETTKNLPVRNPPKPAIDTDCPADFQSEVRKILVTLVQASAKILMYSPDAYNFYEILKEKLEAQLNPPHDPKAVKYLVDMGFSERRAIRALRLRTMNTSEALEWLLEHQDDPEEEEEEIQLPSLESVLNEEAGPSSSGGSKSSRKSSLRQSVVKLFKKKGNEPARREPNLVRIVDLLLDSYKRTQRRDFKASQTVIESLEAMGFEKQQIMEALKHTGNNQTNACAWLLGERSLSLQNLNGGMDPDGPIYEAIMNNSQIQLSLTNPKMLIAYLSMLESPMSTSMWMKDTEVSSVLTQIFKTYHAEKHAIHVNRYDDS